MGWPHLYPQPANRNADGVASRVMQLPRKRNNRSITPLSSRSALAARPQRGGQRDVAVEQWESWQGLIAAEHGRAVSLGHTD
jgi:hypothetical protein